MKKTILLVGLVLTIVLSYFYIKDNFYVCNAPIEEIKTLQTKLMNEPSNFEQKKIEKAYRNLVTTLPYGVVMTTVRGTIMQANPAYRELLGGYTLNELRNLSYQQLTPKKWHKEEVAIIITAKQKKFVEFKKEYIKKDGTVIPIELVGWLIKNEDGQAIGTGSVVQIKN